MKRKKNRMKKKRKKFQIILESLADIQHHSKDV
jgi:hypothetical protein